MTFRIDSVAFEMGEEGPWKGRVIFDIKGVGGRGEYGLLCATSGGLFLVLSAGLQLLVPTFRIPEASDRQATSRLLAEALHSLGWGPEVDQAGNIVDSTTYLLEPMRSWHSRQVAQE